MESSTRVVKKLDAEQFKNLANSTLTINKTEEKNIKTTKDTSGIVELGSKNDKK